MRNAHKLVGRVLRKVQKIFHRSDGNGWNIPKMHGMVKMTEFIKLFGSGINFYGGPGESHHKYFVKAPGDLTQRRVSEFSKQVANRVYESMAFEVANEGVRLENDKWQNYQDANEHICNGDKEDPMACAGDDGAYICIGSYSLSVLPLKEDGTPAHLPGQYGNHHAQKKKS